MSVLLEGRGFTKIFDGLVAVNNVDFDVQAGSITSLIGPNGAGKTTLLNMISGILPVTRGTLRFHGTLINHLPPHRIAARGIARTFQNVELFDNMTVLENVLVGCHLRSHTGLLSAMTRLGGFTADERRLHERAMQLLARVNLADAAGEMAGDLPFGQQRMLEMARALATEPKLLLLDEVASGLSVREKKRLVKLIYAIRDAGVTVLLVEHDMEMVMDISDVVLVLDRGERIAVGAPAEIQSDARVIAAYLGEELVHA